MSVDMVNEFDEFINVFTILKNDILNDLPNKNMPDQLVKWIELSLNTNLIGGKYNRGLTVLNVYRVFSKSYNGGNENYELSSEDEFLGRVLGWCVEFLQAAAIVADDIMDQSITRRNKPCWYKMKNPVTSNGNIEIGNIAINDSFLLQSFAYTLLKKYFRSKPYYHQLMEELIDVEYNTQLGQLLDSGINNNIVVGDFSNFTIKSYLHTVRYKASYYTIYLPVTMGMIMSGITDLTPFGTMKEILLQVGEYMSVQDDYLDCFGDPEVTGKIGTDIEENKRTWLICQAISNCNDDQIELLKKHYGLKVKKDVDIVKSIYNDIDIHKLYSQYEESILLDFNRKIQSDQNTPKEIYLTLLKRYYKRNK